MGIVQFYRGVESKRTAFPRGKKGRREKKKTEAPPPLLRAGNGT